MAFSVSWLKLKQKDLFYVWNKIIKKQYNKTVCYLSTCRNCSVLTFCCLAKQDSSQAFCTGTACVYSHTRSLSSCSTQITHTAKWKTKNKSYWVFNRRVLCFRLNFFFSSLQIYHFFPLYHIKNESEEERNIKVRGHITITVILTCEWMLLSTSATMWVTSGLMISSSSPS